MNSKWIYTLTVGATIAVLSIASVPAVAQGNGGGGGGGRGGGQGRGGQRGFGRGGGMMSPTMLVNRTDVQDDLKLTDDQKTKLKDAQAKAMQEMQAARENAQASGGQMDPAAMKKLQEDNAKTIKGILTDDQNKRLLEIFVQLQGNNALQNEDVQKALGLSDDQKTKIKDLVKAQNDANQELRTKQRNNEIDQQAAQDARTKNAAKLKEELGNVLTADQATKFKDMAGKPFKADPNIRNGGFGGGNGGGGRRGGGGAGAGGSTGGGGF